MRSAFAAALLSIAAAGCSADLCKEGTVLLSYTLSTGAEAADAIDVTLSIGGGAARTMSAARHGRDSAGSIEVDFVSYPAGQSLAFTLTARAGGDVLASASQTIKAAPGCTSLAFALDGGPACPGDAGATDVNCGGGCAPCAIDKHCASDRDCATQNCSAGLCTPVSGPPSWVPVAKDITPGRSSLYSTADLAGRVYAIGGGGGGGVKSDVQCYDPVSGLWIERAPLQAYGYGAATDKAGIIYVLGGAGGGNITNAVFQYDPMKDKWSPGIAMPGPLYYHAALTGPDGKIYTLGGSSVAPGLGQVATFQAFDPNTLMWTALQSLPGPIENLGAVTANGLIYAIGGDAGGNLMQTTTNQALSYDSKTNTWTAVAPLALGGRHSLSAVTAPDGRIYAIGGIDAQGATLSAVEAYHPASNRWVEVASLGTPRSLFGAAVGGDGRIYAIGGANATSTALTTVEAYGPVIAPAPPTGAVGAQVSVSGSNFAAHATVHLWLDQATGAPLATETTDANGALSSNFTFRVPAVSSGSHILIAVDEASQYPTRAPFAVP